jgi:DNA repair protein RadC
MSYAIQNLPLSDRPRERLCALGANNLSLQELVSIIISSGAPKRSVLAIAHELLSRYESLDKLYKATVLELCSVSGIGKAKAVQIKAVLEIGMRFSSELLRPKTSEILSSDSAYKVFSYYLKNKAKEHFVLLCLDSHCRLITEPEIISIGTLDCSLVHPREVYATAIKNSAAKIIVAHNHPSGTFLASRQDIEVTQQLVQAGNIIGIPLLDHLIIGSNNYLSFKDSYPAIFKIERVS